MYECLGKPTQSCLESEITALYTGMMLTMQIGHAGTLDPMATGLLIICTGKGTKSIDTFQAMHKEYSGEQRANTASVLSVVPVSGKLLANASTSESMHTQNVTLVTISLTSTVAFPAATPVTKPPEETVAVLVLLDA